MDIASLARLHKRAQDWENSLQGLSHNDLKSHIESCLKLFKAKIAECWNQAAISPQEENQLLDLERQLAALNDDVRLCGSSHTLITKKAYRDFERHA